MGAGGGAGSGVVVVRCVDAHGSGVVGSPYGSEWV